MTDTSKRRLIKTLAAAGGAVVVMEKWAPPLVESVVLPAHASTTCTLPDLIVRLPNRTRVTCAQSCFHDVDVEVENIGLSDAGSFVVLVELSNGLSESVIFLGLAAGATDNATVVLGPGSNCYDPTQSYMCTATATVDSLGRIEECDESNNQDERTDVR